MTGTFKNIDNVFIFIWLRLAVSLDFVFTDFYAIQFYKMYLKFLIVCNKFLIVMYFQICSEKTCFKSKEANETFILE